MPSPSIKEFGRQVQQDDHCWKSRFMKIQEVHSWNHQKLAWNLRIVISERLSSSKGPSSGSMSVFRGIFHPKKCIRNTTRNVSWSPGSGSATSPQPFRCSHVRFVTDVDGVFTKCLVSSKKWCWFLMWDADQWAVPNWWDMFLMEFGVEVLSILTTSHLASASSGVVLFCWFGGSVVFAFVCQT